MTDVTKEAQYRTQRNSALTQLTVANAILEHMGVKPDALATANNLFPGLEIKDGKVTNFAINDQQKTVFDALIGKKAEASKESEAPAADDIAAQVAAGVKKELEALRVKGAIPEAPEAIPATSTESASAGLNKAAIEAMTPDQINANWDTISTALESGSLGAEQ